MIRPRVCLLVVTAAVLALTGCADAEPSQSTRERGDDATGTTDGTDSTQPDAGDTAGDDSTDSQDPTGGDEITDPAGDGGDSGAEDDQQGLEVDLDVAITAPAHQSSVEAGEVVTFSGVVTDPPTDRGELTAVWTSDRDGEFHREALNPDGSTEVSVDSLSPGIHSITLQVTAELAEGLYTVSVGVCGWSVAQSFDADLNPDAWAVYGDAFRDSRGWLEMTGNAQSRKGAIFNVDQSIQPGDVSLRFSVSTGQCYEPGVCNSQGTGADGFAMSVFQVDSEEELAQIVAAAQSGGGLGYGVSGGYGNIAVNAFHVEFDTWHNVLNNSEHHTDPTPEDHVGVTLDGNPGDHVCWAAVPDFEDNQWHDVEVSVAGEHVRVLIDDAEAISETVPGLSFKGGFIGFTGTTGYYTNYHRFDNLAVREQCDF